MALFIPADADTRPIAGNIGGLARRAGGGYDKDERAWYFGDDQRDLYDQAVALKTAERAARGITQSLIPDLSTLPNGPALASFIDAENDHEYFVLQSDSITERILQDELLVARFRQPDAELAERNIERLALDGDGNLVFANQADRDTAVNRHNELLRAIRSDQRLQVMNATGGINIAHEATYAIADQMRVLEGKWVRSSAGGFWHFDDADKGTKAQEILTDFLAQPPSIVDPNATYCRKELAKLGWYNRELDPPAWIFPNDQNLAKANELVAAARSIEPNEHDSDRVRDAKANLKSNLYLIGTLATAQEAQEIFGFNPVTQPERLAYLDQFSAQKSVKTARDVLAKREINLDREIADDRSHPTVRAANEIVTGAAARATLPTDSPRRQPANYEAEHDEAAVLRAIGADGDALLRSVREQLGAQGINSPNFRLAQNTDEPVHTVGPIVAHSAHYAIQRVDTIDQHGHAALAYAIIERGRIRGHMATNDALLDKVIQDGVVVGAAGRDNWIFLKNLSKDDPAGLGTDIRLRSFLNEVKLLDLPATEQPSIDHDKAERDALLASTMPLLQKSLDALARDRETAFLARDRAAQNDGHTFDDRFAPPPALHETSLDSQATRLIHGKIVGNYGQKPDRESGKLYQPPASKHYVAITNHRRPSDVVIFDARLADTVFGTDVAIRRSWADNAKDVTAGWVDGHLVVGTGTLNQNQLIERRKFYLKQPQKERRAPALDTGPELETGTYDSIMRSDLEVAQRLGRETLARTLGRDLDDIKVHLTSRGQDPSTNDVLQFAGIGSHIVSSNANETLGAPSGAEVLLKTRLHTVIEVNKGITIGQRSAVHQKVAALPRAEIYLVNEHREPEVGERVVVSFESGILKSCNLYTGHQQAIEAAAATLGTVRREPNYASTQREFNDRLAAAGGMAVLLAAQTGWIAKPEQARRIIEARSNNEDWAADRIIDKSDNTRYEGQVFKIDEILRQNKGLEAFASQFEGYYVQLLDNENYIVHDGTQMLTPLQQGSYAALTYRDEKIIRGDAVAFEDYKRDLRNLERPTSQPELAQPSHDMEMGRGR